MVHLFKYAHTNLFHSCSLLRSIVRAMIEAVLAPNMPNAWYAKYRRNSRKSNEKRREYFRRTICEVMETKSNGLFFIYRSYVHTIYISILLEHMLGDQEWPVNPLSLSRRQVKIDQSTHKSFLHLFKGTLVLTPSEEKLSYVVLKSIHTLFRLC
jgi:hypothetical protein